MSAITPVRASRLELLKHLHLLDRSAQQTFNGLVETAARLTGAPMAMVSLLDAEWQHFFARTGTDLDVVSSEVSFCIHCVAAGTPILVEDAAADARFAANPFVAAEPRIRSYLGVPIREPGGRVIGTFCILSQRAGAFGPSDIAMIEPLAHAAEGLIMLQDRNLELETVNSRLEQETWNVSQANAIFLQAEKISKMGVWQLNLENNELFWSKEVYRLHKHPISEKITVEEAVEYYCIDDKERIGEAVANAIALGAPYEVEASIRDRSGSIRRVKTIGERIDRNGKPESIVGVIRDITEETRACEANAQMGAILDDASNEIYVFDAETLQFSWVNRGARENLGYAQDEILQIRPIDINPEFEESELRALLKPLTDGGQRLLTFATVHRRKDGSDYPVSVSLSFSHRETRPVFVAIIKDVTEERENAEKFRKLAFHDPLTGLANRSLLMDRLDQAIAKAQRNGSEVQLLFMDLNRFKEINDTRGHGVGDQVITQVADRLRSVIREHETLARLGGDEFIAVLEGTDTSETARIIKRLNKELEVPVIVEGKSHILSVSIGIASFPRDCSSAVGLLQLADIAMYAAKSDGGGYRFYDEQMGKSIAYELELADRLKTAIAAERLEVHLQPIVDLKSGALVQAEALVRWHDEEWGWVAPSAFIPIAEKRRMMSALGALVIDRTCAQIAHWCESEIGSPPRIAINVAAEQLETGNLLSVIRTCCKRYGISPTCLAVEITESSMMSEPRKVIRCLKALKAIGVSISIDDFGTGYSSLTYLKQFAVNNLKIDMSFVKDIINDPNCLAIVSATIGMAHGLGLKVVAEGVETSSQALKLRQIGCDRAQGFLYGPALSPDAFAEAWLHPQDQDVSNQMVSAAGAS